MRNITFIFLIIILTFQIIFSKCLFSTENVLKPQKTNLEIIQDLSTKILDSVLDTFSKSITDTINYSFIPSTNSWVIDHTVSRRLKESTNKIIKTNNFDEKKFSIELGISNINVGYDNIHREKIFGSKKGNRTIKVDLSIKVSKDNELLLVKNHIEKYSDTIFVDSINELENTNIPITCGKLSEAPLTERLIIPAVIVTSIGVIVYLFFTIRK